MPGFRGTTTSWHSDWTSWQVVSSETKPFRRRAVPEEFLTPRQTTTAIPGFSSQNPAGFLIFPGIFCSKSVSEQSGGRRKRRSSQQQVSESAYLLARHEPKYTKSLIGCKMSKMFGPFMSAVSVQALLSKQRFPWWIEGYSFLYKLYGLLCGRTIHHILKDASAAVGNRFIVCRR